MNQANKPKKIQKRIIMEPSKKHQGKKKIRSPKDDNILELTFEESDSTDNSQSDDSFEFDDEDGSNKGCFHCKPHLFGLNDKLLEISAESEQHRNYLAKNNGLSV